MPNQNASGSVFNSNQDFKRLPDTIVVRYRALTFEKGDAAAIQMVGRAARMGSDQKFFLPVEDAPSDETTLEIELTPKGTDKTSHMLARVCWKTTKDNSRQDEYGMGIERLPLTNEEYKRIVMRAKRGSWLTLT